MGVRNELPVKTHGRITVSFRENCLIASASKANAEKVAAFKQTKYVSRMKAMSE